MDFYLHVRAERTRRIAPSAFPSSPTVPPVGCGCRTRELSARQLASEGRLGGSGG